MRFAEIALLALPMLAYVVWRTQWPDRGPPRAFALFVVGSVLLMGVLLVILRLEEAAPRDAAYVPSRIEDGRVVPGHAEPVVPGHAERAPSSANRP